MSLSRRLSPRTTRATRWLPVESMHSFSVYRTTSRSLATRYSASSIRSCSSTITPRISSANGEHIWRSALALAYAGPLADGTATEDLHPGAFVGTVNAIEDEIATQRKLGEIAALVAHVVNDEVRLRKAAPQLVLSTRIAVAGEAAVAPLQYAYFLPEDGGASCEGPPMTVVFEDVYAAHCATSSPRSTLLDLASHSSPELLSMKDALTWFRGHDLAHFVRPLAGPRVVDVHARIVVSEAFSDAIGYLWMRRTGVTAEAASHFFLTELLRYMSQGLAHGGDAAAAFVELSYLVSAGAAEVTPKGRCVGPRTPSPSP